MLSNRTACARLLCPFSFSFFISWLSFGWHFVIQLISVSPHLSSVLSGSLPSACAFLSVKSSHRSVLWIPFIALWKSGTTVGPCASLCTFHYSEEVDEVFAQTLLYIRYIQKIILVGVQYVCLFSVRGPLRCCRPLRVEQLFSKSAVIVPFHPFSKSNIYLVQSVTVKFIKAKKKR